MKTGSGPTTRQSPTPVHESSGNVFRDLEIPDSDQERTRAELAGRIVTLIRTQGLTQSRAGELLGIDQPGVSDLVRGKLRRYSLERLLRFLVALGQDVEIQVGVSKRRSATLRVVMESETDATKDGAGKRVTMRSPRPDKKAS